MKANRTPTKLLSPAQKRMLEDVRDHDDTHRRIHGRSMYGGALATTWSLKNQGLLDADSKLTAAGMQALENGRYHILLKDVATRRPLQPTTRESVS